MTEQDISKIIEKDEWMMRILIEAEKLDLPDWMIGAGFLRNKIWDFLHQTDNNTEHINDIDLIYFNPDNSNEEKDKELSKEMRTRTDFNWEIVNQAYTHKWHKRSLPYKNTEEALSEWVETATCIAVTLNKDKLKIIAPYGIDDLVNLIVRPNVKYKNNLSVFYNRIESKNWLTKWPKLKIIEG